MHSQIHHHNSWLNETYPPHETTYIFKFPLQNTAPSTTSTEQTERPSHVNNFNSYGHFYIISWLIINIPGSNPAKYKRTQDSLIILKIYWSLTIFTRFKPGNIISNRSNILLIDTTVFLQLCVEARVKWLINFGHVPFCLKYRTKYIYIWSKYTIVILQ